MGEAGIFAPPDGKVVNTQDDLSMSEDDEEEEEGAVAEPIAKPSGKPKGKGRSVATAEVPRRTSSRVQKKKEGIEPDMRSKRKRISRFHAGRTRPRRRRRRG